MQICMSTDISLYWIVILDIEVCTRTLNGYNMRSMDYNDKGHECMDMVHLV